MQKRFCRPGEENILLRSFDERIDGMEGLTQAQKESYKQRNREAVQTYCLPAYQTMADGLEKAKDESSDGSLPACRRAAWYTRRWCANIP